MYFKVNIHTFFNMLYRGLDTEMSQIQVCIFVQISTFSKCLNPVERHMLLVDHTESWWEMTTCSI